MSHRDKVSAKQGCACLSVVHQPRPEPLDLLDGCDSAESDLPKALGMERAICNPPKHLRTIDLSPSAKHPLTASQSCSQSAFLTLTPQHVAYPETVIICKEL